MLNRALLEKRGYGAKGLAPSAPAARTLEAEAGIASETLRRFLARSETDRKGECTVFFELNGQPRTVRVADRSAAAADMALPKAEEGNPGHLGAPMPGMVVKVFFAKGEAVEEGDVLVAIEAMKMETVVRADRSGRRQTGG